MSTATISVGSDAVHSVAAVPSNSINCLSLYNGKILYENGEKFPYESDFFNSGAPVCGVVINFYRTTEEAASYKMYQEGGGFLGYCYPQQERKLTVCNGVVYIEAHDDYVCYSSVCE
jgi:hypothetical protein